MKVKELLKKVNGASVQMPVILREGVGGKERKATSFDFSGYYSEENDRTVMSISLESDKMVIYYK